MLITDTNSLAYQIKTNDVYEYFYENKDLYDFTDYPKDTKSFETVNKKVISKMKDEFKTKIISEFVGLKLKVHSLIDVDNEKEKVQIS